jgi:hypothetical protein
MEGPGVFDRHIETEHNMWAYLNFIIFIRQQDQDDDDGLEQYVRRCLNKKDIGWFPSNKCLMLKEATEDGETVILGELSRLTKLCERMEKATEHKLSGLAADMEKIKTTQKMQLEHSEASAGVATPGIGGALKRRTTAHGHHMGGNSRPRTGEQGQGIRGRPGSPVLAATGEDVTTDEYCEV